MHSVTGPVGMGIDPHADLFEAPDKFIRVIRPEHASFYNDLLSMDVIGRVTASGQLVPAKASARAESGKPFVIEHPRISPVTYPFEWTASMFKDACLLILQLNVELMAKGLCLQDAHPWNVLFRGTSPSPVFVDFTSLVRLPDDGRWPARDEFNGYCSSVLTLMSRGFHSTARSLQREIFETPDRRLVQCVDTFVRPNSSSRALRIVDAIRGVSSALVTRGSRRIGSKVRESNRGSIEELRSLISEIERLEVGPGPGAWSTYYDGTNSLPRYDGASEQLESLVGSTPKHALVDGILGEIRPRSVLDIGCNRGLYSQMAARRGATVVGIDLDEAAIDSMYRDSRRLGTAALPLYVNAVAPAQAVGFQQKPFPSANDRLRSECVLCLAVVHHLVFKRTQMDFDHIAALLASYSTRSLIVEFVPKEDEHVSNWYTDRYSWYTLDGFMTALRRHFSSMRVFESFPASRQIIVCER